MNPIRFSAIAAFLWLSTVTLAPAAYADDVGELTDKLNRVERDLRELQYEVYKGNPPAPTPGHAGGAPSSSSANAARLNDLEESLRDIRGQVETLAFQVKQLNEQLELSRKETNFRLGALEGGAPVSAMTAPASAPAAAGKPQKMAPDAAAGSNLAGRQGGTLGSLPSSDVADAPSATLTPRQQYDAAMELLTRAQYPEAQSAFKSFVASNPKDELAGPAQFWVGEISFTQKDYKSAAGSYADVIKRFPKTTKAPEAMLKLGLSLLELGQKKEGCTTLGAIKTRFPNAGKTTLDRAAKRAAEAKCS